MEHATYDSLCDNIYEQIYQKLQRRDDDRLRFATHGTAKAVLHDGNLRKFWHSLASPASASEEELHISEADFIERIKARNLYEFLAVLIFARCRVAAARTFVTRLVAADSWPVFSRRGGRIGSLPAGREELEELFGSVVAVGEFFAKQACFSTIVLRKREEVRVDSRRSYRLPYLDEKPLREGSFGKVFRVRVAKGHFYDPYAPSFKYNTAPMEMARKDYVLSDEFRAQDEREIMEKILDSSSRTCDNIVENFGSLEISPTTYSLFMPLAICDLRAYMMELHQTRPNTREARAEIIFCAEGLASGLSFLHNEMKTPDLDDLVCYHMDLKPNNILIFREKKKDQVQNIWKLSDFGMSRVKITHRGQGGEREKDFARWFVRRRRQQDPSASATVNRRGEGTYLAPESISSTKSMKTDSDVWSLGCVLSVVLSYIEDGSEGVTRYRDAREQHRNAESFDRFFIRGSRFMPTQVHPEMKRWHSRLIDKATERNTGEGQAVKYMVRFLEESIFHIDPGRRCGAKPVKEMLGEAFKQYRDAENTAGAHKPISRTHGLTPDNRVWRKLHRRNKSEAKGKVNEWYVASAEAFKGCGISPDGTLVAYWTDTKISLYTSQSLSAKEGFEVDPAAEYTLDVTNCFWKSITVTRDYLAACTTGSSFQCYIFDLDRGSTVDASLDHVYRVSLPFPEIHQLAMSPDSRRLACVLRQEEDERKPGSLFHASVQDLINLAASRPSVVTVSSPEDGKIGSAQPWKLISLDWPAADVTDLRISSRGDLHLVIRPELTTKSREHTIPIVYISLQQSTIDTLHIESRGFDTSTTVGFFTAFAPFRLSPACAAVTREKRLHIQAFSGTDPTRDLQKDVPNYRILKLMMGWHDERLFAVGTTSANHKMLLLDISIPRPGESTTIVVRELAQLAGLSYGDEFTERLSDEKGEKYMLIAGLGGGAGRRTIYRVSIADLDVVGAPA